MDDLRPAGPAEYRWLLAVQERERRLLAQAVHDDIGQYLTGIRTQLLLLRCTAGDGQPALARLERYCQGLDDSFRALLRGLPPPALQRQSLDEALRACVADWQEGQGIACELRLGGPLPPLDAAAGTHLYRLLQEALNNVARHAGASRVRIRLQCRGGFLYLSVRDDGRGCAADPAPGFGLDSMRQRARCLGAELSLRSRPGQGLALRLRMPLERDDGEERTMKILLVDDHFVVREGLAALLRGLLPDVEVNEAGDGEEALQAVQREIPSLVIVDLGLPGISGLELTRRLRQRLPQLRVLFFSLHDELALVRQALDAGARGYVTKRAAPTVLLEAIRRVLAGQLYLEQPLATRLACQSWEEQGGAALRGLTRREFEIFRLLARGLALREVAEHLGVSAKTVSNHVSLLKQKLQVSTQAELVHRAIDSGVLRLGLPLPLAEEARGSLG